MLEKSEVRPLPLIKADVSIVPLNPGDSMSEEIAVCHRILHDAGLSPMLHAHGTNVEGDWETITSAVRQCHDALHQDGFARIQSTILIESRNDKIQSSTDKIRSVVQKMLATQ